MSENATVAGKESLPEAHLTHSEERLSGAPVLKHGVSRARLTLHQKMQAIQHFDAHPGMTQSALIEWCFTRFKMTKRLSKGGVNAWFTGKKSQNDKLQLAIANETNPFKLHAKNAKDSMYPDLEHELFAWILRQNQSEKTCLSDDLIIEKAIQIASSQKLIKFKGSRHWILNFKKRYQVGLQVDGKCLITDAVNERIGGEILPESLPGVSPPHLDETTLNCRSQPNKSLNPQIRKGCTVSKYGVTVAPTGSKDVNVEAVVRACGEVDVEDADDSITRVPKNLLEAREASKVLKIFVQENQAEHPSLRAYMVAVEGLAREVERMTSFAQMRQTRKHDQCAPASLGSR